MNRKNMKKNCCHWNICSLIKYFISSSLYVFSSFLISTKTPPPNPSLSPFVVILMYYEIFLFFYDQLLLGLAISPSSYMDSNNGFYTHEIELLSCTKAFSIQTSPGFSDLKSIYQYYHSLHLCKNQSPHFINEEKILTNYSSLSKLVNELLYKENMNPEGMCFS